MQRRGFIRSTASAVFALQNNGAVKLTLTNKINNKESWEAIKEQ